MRNESPLLTIAIPTYNRAKNLDELLTQMLGQINGDPRVQLLISDNCSPSAQRPRAVPTASGPGAT